MRPFKVCCIRSAAEIAMAAERGAWAVGLVGPMPSGPGVLDTAQIAQLVPLVPSEVLGVLLSSEQTYSGVSRQLESTGASALQLCDAVSAETHAELRSAYPELTILQVVHVWDESSLMAARDYAARPELNYLLLDSGRPDSAVRTLGGTGDRHDWSLSRRIVESSPIPVLLAGGLTPQNAASALREVNPFGLDVCSGLRDRDNEYALVADRLAAFSQVMSDQADRRDLAGR